MENNIKMRKAWLKCTFSDDDYFIVCIHCDSDLLMVEKFSPNQDVSSITLFQFLNSLVYF